MIVDDLIQLMRLSGTDKVRAYLNRKKESADKYGEYSPSAKFLQELETMFHACKRDSIADGWPTMIENEKAAILDNDGCGGVDVITPM